MKARKPSKPTKKLVWRITEAAPMGEWVDSSRPSTSAHSRKSSTASSGQEAEVVTSGWMVSSFELRKGADILDEPNTVPGELFDELFPQDKPATDKKNPPDSDPG